MQPSNRRIALAVLALGPLARIEAVTPSRRVLPVRCETLVIAAHTRLAAGALTAIAVAFFERGWKSRQIDVGRLGLGRAPAADQESRRQSYCYYRFPRHHPGQSVTARSV